MSTGAHLVRMAATIAAGILLGYLGVYALGLDRPTIPEVDRSARVLWLGDSMVANAPDTAPWDEGQRLGVAGFRTADVLRAVPQLAGSHAQVIVVLVGVNDLTDGASPLDVAVGVWAVLDALAATVPGARVLVVGVLPGPRVPEATRRETNALLSGLGAHYLEPPTHLETVDGLHLSGAGYGLLGVYVREAIERINPDKEGR